LINVRGSRYLFICGIGKCADKLNCRIVLMREFLFCSGDSVTRRNQFKKFRSISGQPCLNSDIQNRKLTFVFPSIELSADFKKEFIGILGFDRPAREYWERLRFDGAVAGVVEI